MAGLRISGADLTNLMPIDFSQSEPDFVIGQETDRIFLVLADDSEEMRAALRYAGNRAKRTGGKLALLYVSEMDKDFQHWMFVGNLMEEEARASAENALKLHAKQVQALSGRVPDMYVRTGDKREEVFKLVKDHPEISILVLALASGSSPGPMVEAVTGKFAGKIGIPVTLVPGSMTDEEIDRLTTG